MFEFWHNFLYSSETFVVTVISIALFSAIGYLSYMAISEANKK